MSSIIPYDGLFSEILHSDQRLFKLYLNIKPGRNNILAKAETGVAVLTMMRQLNHMNHQLSVRLHHLAQSHQSRY